MKYIIAILILSTLLTFGCNEQFYKCNCRIVDDYGLREGEQAIKESIGDDEYTNAVSYLCEWLLNGNQLNAEFKDYIELGHNNEHSLKIFMLRSACISSEFSNIKEISND